MCGCVRGPSIHVPPVTNLAKKNIEDRVDFKRGGGLCHRRTGGRYDSKPSSKDFTWIFNLSRANLHVGQK